MPGQVLAVQQSCLMFALSSQCSSHSKTGTVLLPQWAFQEILIIARLSFLSSGNQRRAFGGYGLKLAVSHIRTSCLRSPRVPYLPRSRICYNHLVSPNLYSPISAHHLYRHISRYEWSNGLNFKCHLNRICEELP